MKSKSLNKNIILIWPPWSGKSSLMSLVKEKYSMYTIELWIINRSIENWSDRDLQQKILKQHTKKRDRDPEFVMEIIDQYTSSQTSNILNNWSIIDGLKNQKEITLYLDYLKEKFNISQVIIIILEIDKKTAIKRLNERLDRTYNSTLKSVFDYRFKKINQLISTLKKDTSLIVFTINVTKNDIQEVFKLFRQIIT